MLVATLQRYRPANRNKRCADNDYRNDAGGGVIAGLGQGDLRDGGIRPGIGAGPCGLRCHRCKIRGLDPIQLLLLYLGVSRRPLIGVTASATMTAVSVEVTPILERERNATPFFWSIFRSKCFP